MMGICLIQKDETSCGAGRHLSGFEFLSFAVASIMYLGDVRREQKRPGTEGAADGASARNREREVMKAGDDLISLI